VIVRTNIAFGSPNKQDTAEAHGSPLGEKEVALTKEALGWPKEPDFFVPVDVLGVPSQGVKTSAHVFGERDFGAAPDRDLVVVVHADESSQPEPPCQRGRLGRDPLHQVAVAGEHEGAVVHQVRPEHRSQVCLRHCHSHGRAEALTEGSGGRLDAQVRIALGMTGRDRTPPSERADVIQAHREAAKVEERVKEHRTVAVAEDETVAIRPSRSVWIDTKVPAPQHRGDVGHPHRHPGMATLRLLHGIHRKNPDRVDGKLFVIHEPEANAWSGDRMQRAW